MCINICIPDSYHHNCNTFDVPRWPTNNSCHEQVMRPALYHMQHLRYAYVNNPFIYTSIYIDPRTTHATNKSCVPHYITCSIEDMRMWTTHLFIHLYITYSYEQRGDIFGVPRQPTSHTFHEQLMGPALFQILKTWVIHAKCVMIWL